MIEAIEEEGEMPERAGEMMEIELVEVGKGRLQRGETDSMRTGGGE